MAVRIVIKYRIENKPGQWIEAEGDEDVAGLATAHLLLHPGDELVQVVTSVEEPDQ